MGNKEKVGSIDIESLDEIKVILGLFRGQITGSRFLKDKGLLAREIDPKEIDIVIPQETFELTKLFLKTNGRIVRTNQDKYKGIKELNIFEKSGMTIDLFMDNNEVTVISVLNTKLKLSSALTNSHENTNKESEKHKKDLVECLSNATSNLHS